jgi:hypothetical protein
MPKRQRRLRDRTNPRRRPPTETAPNAKAETETKAEPESGTSAASNLAQRLGCPVPPSLPTNYGCPCVVPRHHSSHCRCTLCASEAAIEAHDQHEPEGRRAEDRTAALQGEDSTRRAPRCTKRTRAHRAIPPEPTSLMPELRARSEGRRCRESGRRIRAETPHLSPARPMHDECGAKNATKRTQRPKTEPPNRKTTRRLEGKTERSNPELTRRPERRGPKRGRRKSALDCRDGPR